MQETHHISVCMPMYNASRYLRECIDSVLGQTFHDFEFLIVDDGSTDDSVEIVESYTDPRIRLIKREHDYIASLNCLIDEARGEYIARMDADDVMLPNRLQLQFDYMESHPDIDVLGGAVISEHEASSDAIIYDTARNITLMDLVESNRLNHPSVFIRTNTIRSLGLYYDKEYIYAEDYKLWSDFARHGGKIVCLDIPVVYYRIHAEQTSNRESVRQTNNQLKIKNDNRLFAAKSVNKTYCVPKIRPSANQLTIIIPFLNEGIEVKNTVANIREFAGDSVDIIVINDFSYDGIDYGVLLKPYDVYYFVNFENKGVAASRDFGVSMCKTPYFLLLDAHMRCYESECFSSICKLLCQNDRRILCCQTISIQPDEKGNQMVCVKDYPLAYGAYLTMRIGGRFLDLAWKDAEETPGCDVEDIPVILGACYAASRRYWQYLRGLNGLKCYGSDECYISLKTWLEGGACVLLKKHIFGHYYRNKSPYITYNDKLTYNCFLIAETLLPAKERIYCYASYMYTDHRISSLAIKLVNKERNLIIDLKEYYSKIFTRHFSFFAKYNQTAHHELRNRVAAIVEKKRIEFRDSPAAAGNRLSLVNGLGFNLLSSALTRMLEVEDDCNSFVEQNNNFIRSLQSLSPHKYYFDFEDGAFGYGWLIIYLYYLDLIESVPMDIIAYVDETMTAAIEHGVPIATFDGGAGGMMCYAVARLYVEDANVNFADTAYNVDMLESLYKIAKRIIATPGCEFRTYLGAFEFLTAVSDNNYVWTPDIRDWLQEPIEPINEKCGVSQQHREWLMAMAALLKHN